MNKMFQNPVLDKITTVYKCELVEGKSNKPGRDRKFLATNEFYDKFKRNLDDGVKFNVTGKVDGMCCYIHNNRLMKRRDIRPHKKSKIPEGWIQTSTKGELNSKGNPKHKIGFMDVSMTEKEDKWLRKVILQLGDHIYIKTLVILDGETLIENVPIEKLEGKTVEFVGPSVQCNNHKFDEYCVVPHGMFPLNGYPKDMNYEKFVEWFKSDRLTSCFEGIVVHFENGEMFKIHRHHLDLVWVTNKGLHYLRI